MIFTKETYNFEGELDYCGPGDAGFVDLSIRRELDFRPLILLRSENLAVLK